MKNIPTKDQIRQWIVENPAQSTKRDIALAFGLKGAAKIDLKRILIELTEEGGIAPRQGEAQSPRHGFRSVIQ